MGSIHSIDLRGRWHRRKGSRSTSSSKSSSGLGVYKEDMMEEEDHILSPDDYKRKSSEWEAQVKSAEFIRLRKESLFASTESGLTGLKNLGNTCFMNAAVQCLSATAPLTDYLIGSDLWRKTDLNTKNPLGSGGKIAIEYSKLLQQLWQGKENAVAPKTFKKTVGSHCKRFVGYAQQDAQEFLIFLLDYLHEDLNRVQQKPYVQVPDAKGRRDELVAAEQWQYHLMRNKSIIVDLFQGQLKSVVTCKTCSFSSVTFDPFQYLSLPFPKEEDDELTLEHMFEEFLKPEELTGQEQWYCPKCKQHVDAVKQFYLWKVPNILMIHFKRLVGKRKIGQEVKFDFDLSLEELAHGHQKENPHYDLFGVIKHYGGKSGGHYTACTKNRKSGLWHDFNDSNVTRLENDQIQDRNAYVLFFQKAQLEEAGYRRQSVSNPKHWPHQINEMEMKQIRQNINNNK